MQQINGRNVLLKALLLFAAFDGIFALANPLPRLGELSAYNYVFPGRPRLPYGERPDLAYNLSLFSLEAMFAAHEISAASIPPEEYRVLVIGDSAVWGFLLRPEETLSSSLNTTGYTLNDGRHVRAYNLGYPTMSLTKDLLLLERAVQYQPDMILWLVTLESFPRDKQLASPIVQHNSQAAQALISAYSLNLNVSDSRFVQLTFWDRTLIGQRRALADILRLQFYGVLWAATGIDQDYPQTYTARMEDLPAETNFYDFQPPRLPPEGLAFDVLQAGMTLAGKTPLLIVNEPIFISQGANSDIRYNFYYPRWAYDEYRRLLAERCAAQGWRCLDLWAAIPPTEFTNTAIHLTPRGSAQLARLVGAAVVEMTENK